MVSDVNLIRALVNGRDFRPDDDALQKVMGSADKVTSVYKLNREYGFRHLRYVIESCDGGILTTTVMVPSRDVLVTYKNNEPFAGYQFVPNSIQKDLVDLLFFVCGNKAGFDL